MNFRPRSSWLKRWYHQCMKKKFYETFAEADKKFIELVCRAAISASGGVYKCRFCSGYHLTSDHRNNKQSEEFRERWRMPKRK